MRESERGGWTTTGKLRAALAFVLGIVLILLKHEVPPWAEDVFHEVGFALLVAVIIWVTFDYFSHYDEEERWRSRIEQITGEVFYGVLRRKLPKELVAEANILVLDQIFIRKNLTLDYVLEDKKFTDASGLERPYVMVSATVRFTVKNISDQPQNFPIAVLVPNPTVNALKHISDVTCVTCTRDGKPHSPDITTPRAEFRATMEKSSSSHVKCLCDHVELAPDAEADVDIRYVMPKEEEDSENFESLYPSDSLRLMVVDRGPQRRRVGASAHHPSELEDQTFAPDGGPYQYRLNRYLLPHQGASIWWKKA